MACSICLDTVTARGVIDACDHLFCYDCIIKWGTSAANTCPVCKRPFHRVVEATVEPAAWQIELERVTPLLKMQILSDPKEWRNRLVNTKSHQEKVASLAPETYVMLDRLSEDMERTLQAVRKSEQKLNQQCKDQVD